MLFMQDEQEMASIPKEIYPKDERKTTNIQGSAISMKFWESNG